MNKPIILLALTLLTALFWSMRTDHGAQATTAPRADGHEYLIVFTQADDTHFQATCLPQLEAWAKSEGITLRQLDAADGAPEEITATPAILFQNERGRAIYASRYAELGTIKNFVRTNRLRPQNNVPFCAENVLQWTSDRAQLSAPLKLTEVQRENQAPPLAADFAERARAALYAGMSNFTLPAEACLARTDRAFYCDVHPYLTKDGTLFLSLELYSMFNCIRPVFTSGELPLRGTIDTYEELFIQAGVTFQKQIIDNINNSTIGDAWTPLAAAVPSISWASLYLDLPETIAPQTAIAVTFDLQSSWTTEGAAIPGVPPLFFRFMPPLDRYAGEVPELNGSLQLNDAGSLQSGTFTADLRTLTMGMAELDDKVKRKYIYTKRFPTATFRFERADTGVLQSGRTNRVPVNGTFTFMKKEIPLLVQAEITPQLAEDGTQQLLVHVPFALNITDDFGVQGPDGPNPASKTMEFDLNFFMSPEYND